MERKKNNNLQRSAVGSLARLAQLSRKGVLGARSTPPHLRYVGYLTSLSAFVLVLGALLGAFASSARAQSPDVRNIRPVIMLGIDTSGSMERDLDCACVTTACIECVPTTDDTRNRWSTVVETLTGTLSPFQSTVHQTRDSGNGYATDAYDYLYYLPHVDIDFNQPQSSDGILDVYRDRVKFGLMTFDTMSTRLGEPQVMTETIYNSEPVMNSDEEGEWSYGNVATYGFENCSEPHALNNGARNESATGGGLISVGPELQIDPITGVAGDPLASDHWLRNTQIQDALTEEMSGPDSLDAIRPYGGTPIAGLLSDIEYYFTTHNDVRSGFTIGVDADGDGAPDGDPFYECRERYAILTTDGRPGSSMRGDPVFCENSTLAGYECPYPLPEDIAANLCAMSGGECTGVLDGLFVVGLNVSETDIRDELDRIALNGGTTQAYFASTAADLRSALDTILSQASRGTTTRTSPAFSRTASPGSLTQYQFNSGFRIPENENAPWEGVLERRRFSCSGTTVEEQTLTASDRFHETINAMDPAARNIWTVTPTNPGLAEGRMEGSVDTAADYGVPMPGDPALERGLGLVSFTAANIAPDYFNLSPSETGQRDDIVEWIRGDHPDREDNHFGDIYHSSPAVVGPPGSGIDDDSYNDFRELPHVATRPIVVYVGTNDGLLHAIAAEDTTGVTDQSGNVQSVSEGEELWAFAPPMILSKLDAVTTGHTWTVDGIPMVKDVFLGRDAGGGDSNDYRTVLVMGFRAGGNGYFALDVTSPLEPEFLWQFSTPTMGEAYGQPAIGQVLVEINGQLHERGVVVVGGGRSSAVNTSGCAPPASHFSDPGTVDGYASRSQRGCYGSGIGSGKALYVLDVATGRPLARIEEGNFHAPVSGSVSLYSGAVGSIATSGYFTDEDGILYRLDLSSTNPSNWSVSGLFDLYSGRSATEGQSSFYPPVVAVDEASNPIVIVGTGDVDRLDTAATFNRIFSFKEEVQFDSNGAPTGSIDLTVNWKLDLDSQELVTGPIDYFDGVVYFGTFVSAVNPTDYCSFGASRMWGLDYIQEQSPSGSEIPVGRFESLDGSGDPIEVHRLSGFAAPSLGALTETVNTDLENTVVLGVGVSQEPTCVTGASVNDPYVASSTGSHFQVNGSSGSRFRLVAQLSGGDSNNSMPGGTVNEFSQDLEPPAAFTNVRSVAVSVD